ncbi:MAG: hypothetical protein ACJ754_01770 [Pyrinomonadaceae bacterium]
MALFVFGADAAPLGRMGDLQCSVCNAKRPFNAAARYSYFQVAIFGVAGLVQYSIMCAACQTTWPLSSKQAKAYKREGLLVPPDMPPLRRYGLPILAVVIGALIALNKFGPLVTGGLTLAAATAFILPGVVKGVKKKGIKAYTKEAVAADRPVSLFESVGGPPAGDVAKRDRYRKCPTCGLNNAPADCQCERCGATLTNSRRA